MTSMINNEAFSNFDWSGSAPLDEGMQDNYNAPANWSGNAPLDEDMQNNTNIIPSYWIASAVDKDTRAAHQAAGDYSKVGIMSFGVAPQRAAF